MSTDCFKDRGAQNLLRLADILDAADAGHRARGEPAYRQSAYRHACGTPACAIGHWVAAHPERWTYTHSRPHEGWPLLSRLPIPRNPYLDTDAYRLSMEEEFCIHADEASELFGGFGCGGAKTGAEAATYIRKFVFRKLKCA